MISRFAERCRLRDRFSSELPRKLRKDLHFATLIDVVEMLLKQILTKAIAYVKTIPRPRQGSGLPPYR